MDSIDGVRQKVDELTKSKKLAITRFASLGSPGVAFFNCVCQVVSVLVRDAPQPPVLRVCDGTCQRYNGLKPLFRVNDAEIVDGSVRDDELEIALCTIDIACYDNYSEKARQFKPGDFIYVSNVHAVPKDRMVAINMHGDGTRGRYYNRGIELLVSLERHDVEQGNKDGGDDGAALVVEVVPEDGEKDKQPQVGATIEPEDGEKDKQPQVGATIEQVDDGRTRFFEEESDPGDNSFDEADSSNRGD